MITLIPDFNKENLPAYFYNYFVALILYLSVGTATMFAIIIAVAVIYGESTITYAVMISSGVLYVLIIVVFAIFESKLYDRVVKERAEELEEEFQDMPFEDAVCVLKERGIINETGFVFNGKDGVTETIMPFEKAKIGFSVYHIASRINLNIVLFSEETEALIADSLPDSRAEIWNYRNAWAKIFDRDRSWEAIYSMDSALYNFVFKKHNKIHFDKYFELLTTDKISFARHAMVLHKPCQLDIEKYRL